MAALTFVLTIGAGRAGEAPRRPSRQLFGPSAIVVTAGGGFFLGGPRGAAARLTLDDAAALAEALPEIEAWDPMQIVPSASGAPRRRQRDRAPARRARSAPSASGAAACSRPARYLDAAAGRRASARGSRCIGATVARTLFGDEDPIGAEIQIGSVPFRVTGVLERLGTDIHGMDRDNEIVIPISTAMRRVMNVDTLRAVKLVVRDPDRVDATARRGDARPARSPRPRGGPAERLRR